MRHCNRLVLMILAASILATSVSAADFHSWENSLEGWSIDPNSSGATAVPASLASGAPAGAITDGNYALQIGRPNGAGWTAAVRATGGVIYNDLITSTTLDLDVYVPSSSYQSWGNMQLQIEGQGMNISKTLPFNANNNSYHLTWDYGVDPGFNPTANWSQLTLAIQGAGSMDPVYLDNFQLSNSFTGQPNYTLEGNHKVYLNEQFDGDLKIWREPSNVYSGPDSILSGDGSLVRAAVGEPGWRTRFRHGNELTGRVLLGNNEAAWYMDPWYEGASGSPLGVNPFKLQNGKLHITADEISPTVLNGLPANDGSYVVQDEIDYTSGILTTQNLAAVKYGHFEMRAQLPSGRGLWPALWLLPSAPGWPPEIDILESHGHLNNKVHIAAHLTQADLDAGFTPIGGWIPTDVDVPGTTVDITAGFHDYSLDWSADEIIWYFDNVEIGRMDTPPSMQQEMYLLVNLAVGGPGSWPGPPTPTTPFPKEFIIDYIRITQPRADLDSDGLVDSDDLALWQSNFGSSDAGDTDDDSDTDGADFLAWQTGFNATPGAAANASTVPEPTTTTLAILFGLLGAGTGRRKKDRR